MKIILQAWTEDGPTTHSGTFYTYRFLNPWPRPYQRPHPPCYIVGTGSPETIEIAAELGFGYASVFVTQQRAHELNESLGERATHYGHTLRPDQLPLLTFVYVAETQEEAEREYIVGLTELTKQLVIWYEINRNRTMSRYIFADVPSPWLYELLLAIALVTIGGSWYLSRTRLGFALRAIGEDETVARHTGINTTRVKVLVFALSAGAMALVGAVLALRYPYVDPSIAFNSTWSFQVLIAALLGGPSRPWRPALGAIPLVLLSEYLAGSFPHHFGIALGLCFVVIVFFLPRGVAGSVERLWHALGAPRARAEAH